MKHQKIVHALDRILYLIEKQAVPYQGAQKTATSTHTLLNPRNFIAIVRQDKHRYLFLCEHICSIQQKGFLYVSLSSQSEKIGMAKCTI